MSLFTALVIVDGSLSTIEERLQDGQALMCFISALVLDALPVSSLCWTTACLDGLKLDNATALACIKLHGGRLVRITLSTLDISRF